MSSLQEYIRLFKANLLQIVCYRYQRIKYQRYQMYIPVGLVPHFVCSLANPLIFFFLIHDIYCNFITFVTVLYNLNFTFALCSAFEHPDHITQSWFYFSKTYFLIITNYIFSSYEISPVICKKLKSLSCLKINLQTWYKSMRWNLANNLQLYSLS